jgi:hypothetical protein
MKLNLALATAVVCVVLAVAIFASVTIQHSFPIFGSSNQSNRYVDVNQDVGAQDSRFMWDNNSLALIAQAFALFAAAAATLGLLRIDNGEEQ